ncbi:hypothetical protein V6N11_032414 [Hibiscus sabdariffa]|uniref:Uncharacterized protein n=1 Tax=Hibiscus sabdariffa TaxID=183260 RepID=A0ABR2T0K8_9ROSI
MQGESLSNDQPIPANSTTVSVCDRTGPGQGNQVSSPGVSTTPVGRESTDLADSSSAALVNDQAIDNWRQVDAAAYEPQVGVDTFNNSTSVQSDMGADVALPDSNADLVTNEHHMTESVDVAGSEAVSCSNIHPMRLRCLSGSRQP